ncbi:MAG: ATP-binding cassette domain-containing protein [bacterium]|nr:ATP-binding cassette domain-containing protein [bacterium]
MIEVKNLTKKYNSFVAVDNISFKIERGEIVGFLGPNGAGKTTTLRVITGYFPPTNGSCRIAGFDIEESPIEAKSKIGYLPENNPLYHEMKVIEYLEFISSLRGLTNTKKRIKEVIEVCKIYEVIGQTIGRLSKGYRQRVGLAQTILHNPEILIMDEPTEGLDPNQIIEVRELIKELGKEKTVFISTHRLTEVEATCKRILIINRGKIVADSPREELYRIARGREVIELALKGPKEAILQSVKNAPGVERIDVIGEEGEIIRYEIETKPDTDPREAIFKLCTTNNWIIIDMHRKVTSLEDVFRELTKE